MRLIPATFFLLVFSSLVLAQSERLPDILNPDAASEAEAQRIGAKIFKLLPLGMFKQPSDSLRADDNPIGLRGGGAYYSFTTESHDQGRTPQIVLGDSGHLLAGFSGLKYGFFAHLGGRDLTAVEASLPEAKYFLSYTPQLYEVDIRKDQATIDGRRVDQMTLQRSVRPSAGVTYLFRTISFEEADIFVVFRVLKIDGNGSVTIVWKKLADFPTPHSLLVPDPELQKLVDAILVEQNITSLTVTARKNMLVVRGKCVGDNFQRLVNALKGGGVRYKGFDVASDCRAQIQ